ncbi:glycosyltransferase family 4 protein [Bacillus sp. EB106-08-02-XG196]|jgi:glycosyltransferase involved in cell wall biosynthesis|uniref:glycosyltransferase family 4 protein n=1 Tax=Bacillus sp. EB106-08-02-XG196 TaxID=2737049 RepID=UPI0015C4D07A|nr:glycosyltransferase family 4 protein [Bacillus sp. EB106-08-02-XG196]NWQ39499.1 glycosyltransferase family 4 protein [Bacillus sp. EB106-08-02-XG196]
MKVAIVHEWLETYAGSEKVLEKILNIFPDADLFALVDFLPDNKRDFIHNKKVNTSFIQNLPSSRKNFRKYLPLFPIAIEQFDLSGYDLIISSAHAVSKGVITGPNQIHISYVHSPIRYAWDLQHQYLKESNLNKGLKGILAKLILHYIRLWDYRTSNSVDLFISNSKFIASRIWKIYRREATVIYPPVEINSFEFSDKKEDFFLTASRMVPYKKIDLIVEAFSKMPEKELVVIGDGSEYDKVKEKAGKNVKLLGYQSDEVLKDYMKKSKAFVFAAEEDFGIIPVEAQACGTPVIAYGKGGALETVISTGDKPTGLFFDEQSVDSICETVQRFEKEIDNFKPENCRMNAIRFSPERFQQELTNIIDEYLKVKSKQGELK